MKAVRLVASWAVHLVAWKAVPKVEWWADSMVEKTAASLVENLVAWLDNARAVQKVERTAERLAAGWAVQRVAMKVES